MTHGLAIIYLILVGVGVLIPCVIGVISLKRRGKERSENNRIQQEQARSQQKIAETLSADSERKAKADHETEVRWRKAIRSHYDQIRSCVEKKLHESWHPNFSHLWFLNTEFHEPVKKALEALRALGEVVADYEFLVEHAEGLRTEKVRASLEEAKRKLDEKIGELDSQIS